MPLDIEKIKLEIAALPETNPFSGVVWLQENGQTVLEQAQGWANRSDAIPNTCNTRFGIASGAKTFTAVAICQLIEKGKLTLETRLTDCLDIPFPTFDPTVNIHHLLSHSSGTPDYFDEEIMDDYGALWNEHPMYKMCSPRDFLPLFQDQPMKFAPGTRWSYNNAGYILLGLIVEQITGQSFTSYIEENIFKPCGMQDSGYFPMDQLPERTALGYLKTAEGGWRTNIYSVPIIGGPDGGVFITAPDLEKFWEAFFGGRLVSESMVKQMITPHYDTGDDDNTGYGYGFWIARKNETVVACYMLGEDPGTAFISSAYPDKGIRFAILGNTGSPTWKVLRIIGSAVRALD